jgi:hypothetical protein
MATPIANASGMGQYFDFVEASMPDTQEAIVEESSTIQPGEG